MIEIRPARPGDGAILLEMTKALAEHHQQVHRVTAKPEDYELHLFCEKPLIGALIGFVDGTAAGAAVWHRSFTTNAAKEIIYLEDLTVLPQFRRRGVGNALIRNLAKTVKAQGYDAIWWLAAGWNSRALDFYKGLNAEAIENFSLCQVTVDAFQRLAGET